MSFVVVPRSSTDATGEQSNSNNNNTLFIGFNQDSTMLAYGKDQGFRIISCAYGFCERVFDHKFIDGGISFVCFMDEDKSTVALVGGGSRPAFAMNKVVFYNYKERKVTNELICPRNIISIHSKKNLFVVVAEDMVYIFDLTTKQQVHSWKTTLNPYGISTFIYNKQKKEYLLTILDEQVGEVKVLTIGHENYEIFSEITVRAHESSIRCVALSQDGSMLATVSEKGTLIRVFNVDTGAKIHEFRRGNLAKEIYSLTFNHKGDLISCVSRETLHVFVVDFKEWKAKLTSNNDNSNNSSLSTIWSYVTTTIYEPLETTPTSTFKYPNIDGISVCTFETNDESILVCNNKGVYVSLKFGWNSNSEPINSDPINKFEALVE